MKNQAIEWMKRVCCAICMLAPAGCHNVPVSGRNQLVLISETDEIAMGDATFQKILAETPRSTNQHYIDLVNRVGKRLAREAGRLDYPWEFVVLQSVHANAFALPGGKVAVYEGILPVCEHEAGLAVVVAHEMAHVLARHGGERMSQAYVLNGVGNVIQDVAQEHDERQRERLANWYGFASKYGVALPYSRKHESEADRLGVMLMARAGYDPSEAPIFWKRFAALRVDQEDQELVEFLSTHPSDERRLSDLYALLPKATKVYGNARQRYGKGLEIKLAPEHAAMRVELPGRSSCGCADCNH